MIYVLSYVSERNVAPHNIPVQSDSEWSPCIGDSNDVSTLLYAESIGIALEVRDAILAIVD